MKMNWKEQSDKSLVALSKFYRATIFISDPQFLSEMSYSLIITIRDKNGSWYGPKITRKTSSIEEAKIEAKNLIVLHKLI